MQKIEDRFLRTSYRLQQCTVNAYAIRGMENILMAAKQGDVSSVIRITLATASLLGVASFCQREARKIRVPENSKAKPNVVGEIR